MASEDFNLWLTQSSDFSTDAQSLILRVFDSASNALNGGWKKDSQNYKEEIAKAYTVDESEGDSLSHEMDWAEDLHRQRQQGVGALSLDWLMCSLQLALDSAKNYLNSTHPSTGSYDSHGWLQTVSNEYQ
jgi:hypothetical protein